MLPSSNPVYQPDLEQAHTMIGRLTVYIEQLQKELSRRAEENNSLHDELLKRDS